MTARLLALAFTLAAAVPARATVAGLTVIVPALVLIVLLAVAVLAVRPALRTVRAYPSCPHPRRLEVAPWPTAS